jgi:uncharacterized protein
MKTLIENAIKYVKELFQNEYSGHDYFHTIRVYKIGKQIAIKENANIEIVMISALLHDVDDIKLSPTTHKNKDNARKFLQDNKVEENIINLICDIISEISYKGIDTIPAKTLEGRIVQDADRLDALGAIGIARAFAYGGNHNRVMYDPDILPCLNMTELEYRNHISTTVNHFYEKLFNLKSLMNTQTAKEIAISRENYMKEYLETFINEWDGVL